MSPPSTSPSKDAKAPPQSPVPSLDSVSPAPVESMQELFQMKRPLLLRLEEEYMKELADKPKKVTTFAVEEDVDEELQAALALSLQTVPSTSQQSPPVPMVHEEDDRKPSAVALSNTPAPRPPHSPPLIPTISSSQVQSWQSSRTVVTDLPRFHSIMWDSSLTTDNDKTRWVSQGMDIRESVAAASPSATQNTTTFSQSSTMLDVLVESHFTWGLVQHFGGPCGVLAAVQAELLRVLLWGPRQHTSDKSNNNNDSFSSPHMAYPRSCESVVPAEELTVELVRHGMAMAVGWILARAALTPPVYTNESKLPGKKEDAVQIVLPAMPHDKTELTWEDLEPWKEDKTSPTPADATSRLVRYTITSGRSPPEGAPPSPSRDSMDNDATEPKRQKINSDTQEENCSLEERIQRLGHAVSCFLETPLPASIADSDKSATHHGSLYTPLDSFRRGGGVILLVLSLAASRGYKTIQQDFDDASSKLTSQFGHCAQELINLLLTGQAVSNVFDNTLRPSGDMICQGIQSQPNIGYLSQLESLRYCEVGGFYKSPKFPIWVVGSTSHFTVLFGLSSAIKESKSDMLLEQCRRAFKGVEGGEENGFITSPQLEDVFRSLNLDIDDYSLSALTASMEVAGAGIILWDEFWKVTSRLMTGASVDAILMGPQDNMSTVSNDGVSNDDPPPPLLLTNGPGTETDEEMARRLAAEYNSEHESGMSALSAAAARVASPMEVEQPGVLSDEELARKLQAEYDAEVNTGMSSTASVGAVAGSPEPGFSDDVDMTQRIPQPPTPPRPSINRIALDQSGLEDSKPAARETSSPARPDFEQYGDTFSLYHYNGLRGGVLTPFRVTRLSAEEAVGASIALNRGGSGAHQSAANGGNGDLEDVIRTKWPSCMINWLGKSPPYID